MNDSTVLSGDKKSPVIRYLGDSDSSSMVYNRKLPMSTPDSWQYSKSAYLS